MSGSTHRLNAERADLRLKELEARLKVATNVERGPSGGVQMPKIEPKSGELFYFGITIERFALHKAARILGMCEVPGPAGGWIKCWRVQFPDGEIAHAEYSEESQGAFELLSHEAGVAKHGEGAFE